jgi:CheY-like chemotaxis protein
MSSYHILIVDDQKDVRRVLISGLQTLGQKLDVIEVPSAEEAMLLAPRRTFDLIVTDVRLPGISGLDLVRRLRTFNPNLKLILITGLSDRQTRKQVEEAGTFAFFYKPIEMGDFLDAVERALGLVETAFAPAPLVVELPKRQAEINEHAEKKVAEPPTQPAPLAPLSILKEQLSVLAVLCLEESGQIVSQAGDFSEIGAQSVVLRALISVAQANQKLSQSMSRPVPDYLLVLDGIGYHLCLAPVGLKHLLVLVGNQPFQNNVALAGGLIKSAAKDLLTLLTKPEVDASEQKEATASALALEVVPPFEPDAELLDALKQVEVTEKDRQAIDDLFSKQDTVNDKVKDLDDFWDTVAEQTGSLNLNEEHITFDQAKSLGLAPET